jgi:hypothetical protein
MLFDEVDEDRGVDTDDFPVEICHQSHAARSGSTCAAASMSRQYSLPRPRRSSRDSASGVYDLRFALFDAATGNGTVAVPVDIENVVVTNGLFTACHHTRGRPEPIANGAGR